ncbi:MAG: pyridoxamine 5'-phosphate oxidase [Cytophagaceae bacterium]
MSKKIAEIRKEYKYQQLTENNVNHNPFLQLKSWLDEAIASEVHEPTAMSLATVGKDHKPSSRIVLLKGLTETGLVFFTNYESKKGTELFQNPDAAILFFWPELERQVRVEGKVKRTSSEESTDYFRSRPKGSQIGALCSPQSQVIPDREFLEKKKSELEKKYSDTDVPRPEHWGGYKLIPSMFEFWQGRESRLHDRLQFTLSETGWKIERLAP